MKNITRTFAALCVVVAVAIAAVSCKDDPDRPEFAVIEKAQTLHSGTSSFEIDYRFEYISWYADDNVMREIQAAQSVDFFGEMFVAVDPMESAKAFDQAVADQYEATSSSDLGWSGFMKIRSWNDVVGDRVVVYTIERAEYTGGAHGSETTECANYDLRTGARLALDDLFTPEGKAALTDAIRLAILKEHDKATWDELLATTCYNAEDEVLPTENFSLSEGHITFVYNPYDIGCYAQGGTKVRLALGDLAGFKKEMLEK